MKTAKKTAVAGVLVGVGIAFLGLSMLLLPSNKPVLAEAVQDPRDCNRPVGSNDDCFGRHPGDLCNGGGEIVNVCRITGYVGEGADFPICQCQPMIDGSGGGPTL